MMIWKELDSYSWVVFDLRLHLFQLLTFIFNSSNVILKLIIPFKVYVVTNKNVTFF